MAGDYSISFDSLKIKIMRFGLSRYRAFTNKLALHK